MTDHPGSRCGSHCKTTVDQANQITPARETDRPVAAFAWHASTIRAVRYDASVLDVVPDPLVENTVPGGEGHCGITGLSDAIGVKPKGEAETRYRALRAKLCLAATPLDNLLAVQEG